MTAAVGFPTLRLVRVRIGKVTLENLVTGEVQILDINYIFV
jgi:23S rRNA pseudouridine2457 synthase